MPETVLEELKRYVRFDAGDERALRALHGAAAPQLDRIAQVFYDRILSHEEARTALVGGESRVGHLKVTLIGWMDTLLSGPWDEAYWEHRTRIGRVHVRIGLPQHYMFGAMNVIRTELMRVSWERFNADPPELERVRNALAKILDLELAIMLHTYRDDLLAQQARVERLSTFGQLVGSIGHDLRNPLGVIETSLYILRGRVGDDERARKHVDRIGEQLGVANGIITNLLDMIRNRPLAREPVDLGQVIAAAAGAVKHAPGVSVAVEGVEGLPAVDGDPGQLRQVFVNLLENAAFAAAPAGAVTVRAQHTDGAVEVAVEDTGPGVDPATRRRLFEPLITTKEKGIGLGLALVKRIAERHGGSVEYSDRPGGGARFTVRLPA
ncbi:histidine kinase [Anaeromyxobacter sp. K]|uniref:sensor histidine kinase n=1 Tax=Anaeromyxobacter sp. (strain K) TaxID=447217 RepID=UPI00015F8D28|nr:protoglobin domain-containing protein [Anaeromyxobacter sp. K]ACG73755.1 histidine kinase [Anaeromyxobacter sp. K]